MLLLSYLDFRYYLYLIYFIFAIIVAFFIPGYLIFSRYKLTAFQKIIISCMYGMVLWAFQAYIAGYLRMPWLTYFYLIFGFIYFIILKLKRRKFELRLGPLTASFLSYVKRNKLIMITIVIGTISQYSSIWSMGIRTSQGLIFCCRSVPDNLYHLGLTNSILRSFPPQEPGMAGQRVQNYYYAPHMIIADLVRVFHLPLISTQTNFIPLYLSILFGCSVIIFSQFFKLTRLFTFFSLFFLYFHSDIFYIISFFTTHVLNIASVFIDNGTVFLSAPPFAFGVVFFFCTLFLLHLWVQKKDRLTVVLLSIVTALLVSTKIYIALFTFIGIFFLSIFFILKQRNFYLFLSFILSSCVALVLYLPVNSGSGGLFFTGFWRVTDFATQPGLGLNNMVLALQVYKQHNNFLHTFVQEFIFLILYILTAFGTLTIAFFQTKRTMRLFPIWLHIFLLPASAITLALGLFTLQITGGANTIQFIIFLLYILSFYAALALSWHISHTPRWLGVIIVIIIMAIQLPRIVNDVVLSYIPGNQKDIVLVSNDMLSAISKISNKTSDKDMIALGPDYINNNSLYFPFLTDRKIYLTGIGILQDHGAPYKKRYKLIHNIYSNELDISYALKKNYIDYLVTKHKAISSLPDSSELFYQNNEVDIYKIK